MAIQTYSSSQSRNLIRAAQGMLEHAMPITVLGDFGEQKEHPPKSTDTLVFRRTLPLGALTTGSGIGSQQYVGTPSITAGGFALAEGTTPNARTVTFQDVAVTLQQYGVLFRFTSKAEDLYEDDIPAEMVKLSGETIAEVLETIRYGALKAGLSVVYSNGSSRAAVNTPITLNSIRKAVRVLESNRGKRVTSRIDSSINFGTKAVQPTFLVFVHTDAANDIRNLAGFTRKEDYGSYKPVHDREIGACEDFRFITSPLLAPYLAAGASVGSSGMVSVGGANVDVYPFLVIAESAWASVALRGMRAITPTVLRAKDRNHANPMGQFGFVGCSTWFAAVRLNEAWMLRIEAGVTDL